LHLSFFRWIGKLSYSLYLWHWPILIIAAEYAGKSTLSVKDNLGWDLVALVLSVLTYFLIENPIRHNTALKRGRWKSIGLGAGLIGLTFAVIAVQSNLAIGPSGNGAGAATRPNTSTKDVLQTVARASTIQSVPSNLAPPLSRLVTAPGAFIGFPPESCTPSNSSGRVRLCPFGDPNGSHTVVLYGDSHAGMWFEAMNEIAARAHWRLITLFKPGCPANDLSTPPPGSRIGGWHACDEWHTFAIKEIKKIDPALLVISQTSKYRDPAGVHYTTTQWQQSFSQLLRQFKMPGTGTVVIGNPVEPHVAGQDCLARHTDDVQACSGPPDPGFTTFNTTQRAAAEAEGARFINVVPWFCTTTCSSVIGHYEIYLRNDHITEAYSLFLEGVLGKALGLQTLQR
jgi:hypothetical protein